MVAELAAVKPCTTKAASRIFVALLWSFGDRFVVWRRPLHPKLSSPISYIDPTPVLVVVVVFVVNRLLSVVRCPFEFNRPTSVCRPFSVKL